MKRLTKLLGVAWIIVTIEALLDARENGENNAHKTVAKGTLPVYFATGFIVSYTILRKIPLMPRVLAGMISIPIGVISIIVHIVGLVAIADRLGLVDLEELGIIEEQEELDVVIQNNTVQNREQNDESHEEDTEWDGESDEETGNDVGEETTDDDDDDDDDEDASSFVVE